MTNAQIRVEYEGPVAVLTLDRPARFNAIDQPLVEALRSQLQALDADPAVRAVVLRGEGRAFCGGGDIVAMQQHAADLPAFIGTMIDIFNDVVVAMARLRVPVIAAVHGAVAGGGFSLALAADSVVAARSARFVVAYPKLGTSTDGGLSFRLQQRLGPAQAFTLLTQAEPLLAEEALRLGLVQGVVDDEALLQEAMQRAAALAALAPAAVAELKALVHAPSLPALQEQLKREREAFVRCAGTPDFAQRVARFAAAAVGGVTPSPAARR